MTDGAIRATTKKSHKLKSKNIVFEIGAPCHKDIFQHFQSTLIK